MTRVAGRQVEVDQREGLAVAKHDVLRGHVLVPDQLWRSARSWWQPSRLGRGRQKVVRQTEPGRCVVVCPNETSDRHQPILVCYPLRARPTGDLTLDEGQHLPTGGVDPQEPWRAVEPDALQMSQQLANQPRVVAVGPADGRAPSYEVLGDVAAFQSDLRFVWIVDPFLHGHHPRLPSGSRARPTGTPAALYEHSGRDLYSIRSGRSSWNTDSPGSLPENWAVRRGLRCRWRLRCGGAEVPVDAGELVAEFADFFGLLGDALVHFGQPGVALGLGGDDPFLGGAQLREVLGQEVGGGDEHRAGLGC